jgi:hypothetical protein
MTWDVLFRIINILMSATCLMILFNISRPKWHTYTVKMRNYVMALGGFLFLGMEANLEILLGWETKGPRILILTFVLLFTLTGLLRKNEGYIKQNTLDE